jgi:hypothetical protein
MTIFPSGRAFRKFGMVKKSHFYAKPYVTPPDGIAISLSSIGWRRGPG